MKPYRIINEPKRVVNYFSLFTLLFAFLLVGCVKVDLYDGNGNGNGNSNDIPYSGNTKPEAPPEWTDNNQGDISLAKEYKIGDYYPDPNVMIKDSEVIGTPPIGIVFWLEDPIDGKSAHGKIVSMNQGHRIWSDDPVGHDQSCGANSDSCGLVNRTAIRAYMDKDSTISFPAYEWCEDKNPDGYLPVEKDLSWYLPAVKELRALYAGMSGKQWVDKGVNPGEGEVADWGDSGARELQGDKYDDLREAFSKKLVGDGWGQEIDPSDYSKYWSSTESYDGDLIVAKVISLKSGEAAPSNKFNECSVRAIRKF